MSGKNPEISELLTGFGNKQFDGLEELYDKFKIQVKKCLIDFGWNPKNEGIDVIVNQNRDNKNVLRDILSRHPNWSWEDHAVTIPFTDKLIRHDLQDCSNYYFVHCKEHANTVKASTCSSFDKSLFINQLQKFYVVIQNYNTSMIEGQLTKYAVDNLENVSIKALVGQKMSRVINKWADGCPGLKNTTKYNKLYASLADALNPLEVKRKSILSIHPVDFLLMSYGNSWKSCHLITRAENKEYKSGPISYLQDSVSMIFFTVGDEDSDIHRTARITRQMYHYFQGRIIQSRLYPHWSDNSMSTNYRNIVQATIAECLGIPNLWDYTNNRGRIIDCTKQPDTSTHYRDYHGEYNQHMMTVKGIQCADSVFIGTAPHCIECGDAHSSPVMLSCCHEVPCRGCKKYFKWKTLHRYSVNEYYCKDCLWVCQYCARQYPITSKRYNLYQRDGSTKEICEHCAGRYHYCVQCGNLFQDECQTVYNINHRQYQLCKTCAEKSVMCPDCKLYFFADCITKDGVCKHCSTIRKNKEAEEKAREKQRIRKEREAKEREELLKVEEEKFAKRIPAGMKPYDTCAVCDLRFDCERINWIAIS